MTTQTPLFDAVKPLRVTVPVTPETHAAFVRLSQSQGGSVGKAMGDWLRDTAYAAEQMADMLSDLRTDPLKTALKLSGYAAAMSDVSTNLVGHIQAASKAAEGAGGAPLAGRAPRPVSAQNVGKKELTPPVGNTGGKVSGARTPRGFK